MCVNSIYVFIYHVIIRVTRKNRYYINMKPTYLPPCIKQSVAHIRLYFFLQFELWLDSVWQITTNSLYLLHEPWVVGKIHGKNLMGTTHHHPVYSHYEQTHSFVHSYPPIYTVIVPTYSLINMIIFISSKICKSVWLNVSHLSRFKGELEGGIGNCKKNIWALLFCFIS